mmetsp:Transcript_27664/g.62586  ORF Transcript_27664/g.62586 Transcript_27664/m.62586 type:complete len:116 (+) Transcript_27664:360-707(+)
MQKKTSTRRQLAMHMVYSLQRALRSGTMSPDTSSQAAMADGSRTASTLGACTDEAAPDAHASSRSSPSAWATPVPEEPPEAPGVPDAFADALPPTDVVAPPRDADDKPAGPQPQL